MNQGSIRLEGLQNPGIVKETASFKLVIGDSYIGALAMSQTSI